jgi:hypothetical protein
MIKEVFKDVNYHIGTSVLRGQYHILDQDHNIILPENWDSIVRPGLSLSMQMWSTPTPISTHTPPPFRSVSPNEHPYPHEQPQKILIDSKPSNIIRSESQRKGSGSPPLERRRTLKRRPGLILRQSESIANPPPKSKPTLQNSVASYSPNTPVTLRPKTPPEDITKTKTPT